jgi:hypothetical protein
MVKKIGMTAGIVIIFLVSAYAGERYSQRLCGSDGYVCYKVKSRDTWEKLFPNDETRGIVMRLNRMNKQLVSGIIIAFPKDTEVVNYIDLAPFAGHIKTLQKTVIVDIEKHAFAAYDANGILVRWGPVSTAIGWCRDINRSCTTPRGVFFVYAAGNAYCKSTIYPIPRGGAPMPYCMYFKGGYAMHGGELPGYHASHGCVRMLVEDAEWLRYNFVDIGRNGTKVIVR